jgi:hypothetical protein
MEGFEDPFNRRFFDWEHQKEGTMSFYRMMGGFKNQYKALQQGRLIPYLIAGQVYGFIRQYQEQRLICVVNAGSELYSMPDNGMPMLFEIGVTRVSNGNIQLAPYSCVLFQG